MGLKDDIRAAKNHGQIDAALERGERYNNASAKTRRQWDRLAEARRKELAK